MERHGVDRDQAFGLLRRFSVESGLPIRIRAENVVRSTYSQHHFEARTSGQAP